MSNEFLRPDGDEFSARGRKVFFGMHSPGHADDTDAAFSRVLHVASGVGHKYEVLRRRAAWLISFTIGRRAVAAYEVGLIGQKSPDDRALVRLHFATKNVREAVGDVCSGK